jgi:hypothetical protein
MFCGKSGDFFCGNPACAQYLKEEKPKQKNDLSKISKNFSLYVRQYRYKIREKCNAPEAVQEFNTFTEPIQKAIVEKVKTLRTQQAPDREIQKLKLEVDRKYAEINEKAKEIIERYDAAKSTECED